MCNQAAGLSRCFTKVQDSMVTTCGQRQGSRKNAAGSGRTTVFGDLQPVNLSSHATYYAGPL